MNSDLWYLIPLAAAGLVTLLVGMGIVVAKFYQRAGADEALVRTGSGGERVVIGGGINVFPFLHQVMRVSLKSVPLMVAREGKNALVTADKIKANVTTELYVKVEPTKDDVLSAARSFGARNLDANAVKDLVEGKLTDALRAVAANQAFQGLHSNRKEFAEHVQRALAEELKKNGLTLESVAITTFAQLPSAELDPNDVFDAEGRRAIAETVEANRRMTNAIKRDTDVQVQQKDVESRKQQLNFELDQRRAEADQQRTIAEYNATAKAEQARRIAEIEATQQAEAQKTVLLQQLSQEQAALEKKQAVETSRISQEQAVAKADLDRQQMLAIAAAEKDKAERTAQIESQKAIEAAGILKARTIEATTIEKQKTIETAQIAKQIAVTNAEAERARALAEFAKSSAEQERAEQEILTVEKTSEAERLKQIALIEAGRKAQEERLGVEVSAYKQITHAQAEADSKKKLAEAALAEAQGLANARRTSAQAAADQVKIAASADADATLARAQGDANARRASAQADADQVKIKAIADAEASLKQADAIERLAQAALLRGRAEAEIRQLALSAENIIDPKLVLREVALKLIERSPELVRELMQPISAISDVKVLQVNGLSGLMPAAGLSGAAHTASPFGAVLKTLFDASALAPVMKQMLEFGGVSPEALAEKARELVRGAPTATELARAEAEQKAAVAAARPEPVADGGPTQSRSG
jgi:uncharacterized membrane protein YqiK